MSLALSAGSDLRLVLFDTVNHISAPAIFRAFGGHSSKLALLVLLRWDPPFSLRTICMKECE